jgi:hypothetical protein
METISAPELAKHLGLKPKWLRQLIRDHELMPTHTPDERYAFTGNDIRRIERNSAIKQARFNARESN